MPAAGDERLGQLRPGLLDKAGAGQARQRRGGEVERTGRPHRRHPLRGRARLAHLDVAEAGVGAARDQPHRGQAAGAAGPSGHRPQRHPVGGGIADVVVGVHRADQGLGIVAGDPAGGQGQSRPGAPRRGLGDDRIGTELEPVQGLAAARHLVGGGEHVDGGAQGKDALHRGPEQAGAARAEWQQVLGSGRTAERPEPGAAAPGQDQDVEAHRAAGARLTRLPRPRSPGVGCPPRQPARRRARSAPRAGRGRCARSGRRWPSAGRADGAAGAR